MPYIPLLKPSVEVTKPGVPALDREQRPKINGGAVLSGMAALGQDMANLGQANQMPLVNPAPFVEAAGALGHAVGDALMRTGSVIGAFALKKHEESVQMALNEANSELDATASELGAYYDKNQRDPASWAAYAQKTTQATIERLSKDKRLDGDGQERLRVMGTNWMRKQVAHADGYGARVIFDRNKQSDGYRADTLTKTQDYEGAKETIKGSVAAGRMSEDEGNYHIAGIDIQKRDDHMKNLIASDPRGTASLLQQEGSLPEYIKDESDRFEYLKKAEAAIDANEQIALSEIENGIAAGTIKKSDDLAPWLYQLGDAALERTASALDKRDFEARANDPVTMSSLITKISDFDSSGKDGKLRLIELRKEIDNSSNGSAKDVLLAELTQQISRTREGLTAKDQEVSSSLKEVDLAMEAGKFGVWSVPWNKDLKWDEKKKTWTRPRFEWEGKGDPVAIEIDQRDSIKITAKKAKEGEFIDDLSTKAEAAKKADAIKRDLRKRVDDGELKTPEMVREAFRIYMAEPYKSAASQSLRDARKKVKDGMQPLPGMDTRYNPTQDPNSLISELLPKP